MRHRHNAGGTHKRSTTGGKPVTSAHRHIGPTCRQHRYTVGPAGRELVKAGASARPADVLRQLDSGRRRVLAARGPVAAGKRLLTTGHL